MNYKGSQVNMVPNPCSLLVLIMLFHLDYDLCLVFKVLYMYTEKLRGSVIFLKFPLTIFIFQKQNLVSFVI